MWESIDRTQSATGTGTGATDLAEAFRASGVPWPPHQAADRARVTLFDTRDWRPWAGAARLLLDGRETACVQRRHAEGDRHALALAYALHRLVLADLLGVEPTAVPLDRDANGKPVVTGTGLHTSLSHSGPYVAVAASAAGPIGIDIEPAARSSVMAEIAAQVCHPREAFAFAAVAPGARARGLLALWVRKEALLKAAGIGLAREMRSFVAAVPAEAATQVQLLDAGADCVAAFAGPAGIPADVAWLRPRAMEAAACAA